MLCDVLRKHLDIISETVGVKMGEKTPSLAGKGTLKNLMTPVNFDSNALGTRLDKNARINNDLSDYQSAKITFQTASYDCVLD